MVARKLVVVLVVGGLCASPIAAQVPTLRDCLDVARPPSARDVLVPGGVLLGAAWMVAQTAMYVHPTTYAINVLFGSIAGGAFGARLGEVVDDTLGGRQRDTPECYALGSVVRSPGGSSASTEPMERPLGMLLGGGSAPAGLFDGPELFPWVITTGGESWRPFPAPVPSSIPTGPPLGRHLHGGWASGPQE